MRISKQALKNVKIYNGHDLCRLGGGKIFLSYYTGNQAACSVSHWSVVGIGFNTDPKAQWADYGCKTFSGNMKSPALDEAKAFASEKYGIRAWDRDPFGNWQDRKVMAQVIKKVSS